MFSDSGYLIFLFILRGLSSISNSKFQTPIQIEIWNLESEIPQSGAKVGNRFGTDFDIILFFKIKTRLSEKRKVISYRITYHFSFLTFHLLLLSIQNRQNIVCNIEFFVDI
jgi:hypothetical protein